jgi:hypothetical protein
MLDNRRTERRVFTKATGKVDFVTWVAAAAIISIATISCVAMQLGLING